MEPEKFKPVSIEKKNFRDCRIVYRLPEVDPAHLAVGIQLVPLIGRGIILMSRTLTPAERIPPRKLLLSILDERAASRAGKDETSFAEGCSISTAQFGNKFRGKLDIGKPFD